MGAAPVEAMANRRTLARQRARARRDEIACEPESAGAFSGGVPTLGADRAWSVAMLDRDVPHPLDARAPKRWRVQRENSRAAPTGNRGTHRSSFCRTMLIELCIRDLALFERAELRFGAGLNAITGETGAGKSLLVGALDLLLGERMRGASGDWVRSGAERALVEGRFCLAPGPRLDAVRAWLARELPEIAAEFDASAPGGPNASAERELVLGRSLARDGRTRAHVDQRPVPQKALRALASLLVEVHGQNENQELFDPAEQLRLLDAYGALEPAVAQWGAARATWHALHQRFETRESSRAERARRLDWLRHQLRELDALALRPGERAELEGERELLRSSGDLRLELGRALDALADGDGSALELLQRTSRSLERWRERIARLAEPAQSLDTALAALDESVRALRSLADGVSDDPARLETVEQRLAAIEEQERKHALRAEELAARRDEIAGEVAELERAEESSDALEGELAKARAALVKLGAQLSERRAKLVPGLQRELVRSLGELGLEKASVSIALAPRAGADAPDTERFGEHGLDRAEILLAANPGEPARPLRHVASGGEAARVFLGLRSVLSARESGRTLVFDEIDAGVGGRLGPKVANHMRELGRHHQVLCVTHLPAIAAAADVHLKVAKSVRAGRTSTQVDALSGEAREREVADMIAGGADQATARAEARRLLAAR